MVMLYAGRRADQRARAGRPRPQGRVQEGARGAARAGLHAGADRRRSSRSLDEDITLDRRRNHTIDVVVDRLIVKRRRRAPAGRIASRSALKLADDIVVINTLDGGDRLFSRRLACTDLRRQHAGDDAPRLLVQLAARRLSGVPGTRGRVRLRPARLVPDESLSLADGAIAPVGERRQEAGARGARGAERDFGIDLDAAVRQAAEEAARHRVLRRRRRQARRRRRREEEGEGPSGQDPFGADFEGAVPNLRRRYDEGSWLEQEYLEPYRALRPCPTCARRAPESRRAAPCG